MTGNVKSRSAYERASPVRRGICGSPAAAAVIGMFFCVARCSALISERYSICLDELDLVEQEHNPGALAGSGGAKREEQLREVAGDNALVGVA